MFDTVQEIGFKRAMDRAIKNAIEVACSKSGLREGDILNDEQLRILVGDVVDGMMPSIIHNMTLNDGLADVILQEEMRPFATRNTTRLEFLNGISFRNG